MVYKDTGEKTEDNMNRALKCTSHYQGVIIYYHHITVKTTVTIAFIQYYAL